MTGTDMRVETIRATPEPERLVCEYARGDYLDGFIGDMGYSEIMAAIEPDPRHMVDAYNDIHNPSEPVWTVESPPEIDQLEPAVRVRSKTYYLIEDLLRSTHWGPFEHPQLNLAATGASRVLMAQITRHRHLTFDIQSQRYVDFGDTDDPVKIPATIRDEQSLNREQGLTELDEEKRDHLRKLMNDHIDRSVDLYEFMVNGGMPKEDARFVLPEGTKVNIGFSGNARALLHVMNMRMQADAQWEARELSGLMLEEFRRWMPYTYRMFEKHGPFKLAP